MAKRRHKGTDEILLIPFLDILCSLIGVLILIIVVLCVSQSQQTKGRTPEEIKMAQEYKDMLKELKEREKLQQLVIEKLAKLKEVQKNLEDKQLRFVKLRKILDSSKELKEQNKEISQKLQKELDDLLTEIDGIGRQQKDTQKEIELLAAELKKRQVPPDKKVPPVVVQPSGSGMADTTKVYFVECSSGALKVLGAWGEDYRLAATPSVVVADVAYNHFLSEVGKDKNSLILFLIRDDGQGAFNTGAGRAEADYSIRVGKLPIPGRGQLDLALFDKYRGKISAPPTPGTAAPTPAEKKS
ncbi:hypothetical protein [Prosthecobacter dejongeii]|uniref:Cell division protein ZapA (FtsZ GTPase activity inhibitor) n=1 Tax=Prosthecobacter dejongeii TaxID=48465 RepID=A0A7W8DR62_9BACT|nr:hypothetical protein [Prosthecobacter dejongeii]MBB5039198.1 cell division protein ZapA (FtsZ GTPase activity inhibitor) [Prosthecobacter dejongeii]